MEDFRFDTSLDDMRFEFVKWDMSYNFACDFIEKRYLNCIPKNRFWVFHNRKSCVTYFGFVDSITTDLIHVVAFYSEESGCICKRVA